MKSSIDSSSESERPLHRQLAPSELGDDLFERSVLEDFGQPLATRWRTSGDGTVATFARRHAMERTAGPRGPRLSWSWTASRHGAALALRANLWWPRPFSVLRLEGSFEGDSSVQVLWSVGDVAGRVSTIPRPMNLHAGRDQRWTLDLARLEDRSEEGFRGPLRSLRLQLLSPPVGRAFRWSFDRVLVETWRGPRVGLNAPAAAQAGEPLAVELDSGGSAGELLLVSEAGVLLGRWGAGDEIRLPAHLPAGESRLELWGRGRLLAAHALTIRSAPSQPRARASVVKHRGRPALAVDGRPQSGLAYTTYHPREEFAERFARIGTRLLSFPTTCDYHAFDLAPPAAIEPGRFDFSFVDHVATRLLDRVPEGWLLPRVFISSPPWWDEANPEAMGVAQEGEQRGPLRMVHDDGEMEKACASWASRPWRDWAAEALRRYVGHLRAAPYAERVLGICLASGGTEEWFHWHDERRPKKWGDVGPAAAAAFRSWLRKRYRGDVAALRRAWKLDGADFETAAVPALEALQHSSGGIWRDPARERPAIDFLRFHQEQVATAISAAARVAREESDGEWIIGAFYGYVLVHTGHHRHLNGGHFALERLLASRSVDFLCAPTGYGARALGDGFSYFMAPIESLQRHGLLWFDENDIRTHLLEVSEDRSGSLYRNGYGLTDDVREGQAIQLRELGHCLQRGTPWWWFDIYACGQYQDGELEEVLRRLRSIYDALFECDRRSVAEVAVFVDERAPLYEDGRGRAFLESVVAARESLARLGAPVDEYLLDDLPRLRPYRLYVFLNAVAPSRAVRRAVQRLRRCSDATLLWLGPCGLMRPGRIDAAGPAGLTGLPLRVATEGFADQVVELPAGGRLRRSAGRRWGHGDIPAPRVEIAPSTSVEVWARTTEGQPGMISSAREGARSIHCVAPSPPVELLRDVAELAGVHLYLETGDPLSVSARAITVHGRRPSDRLVLRLPEPAPLFEPWTRRVVSPRSERHTIRIERGETRLFFLGTEGEWRRLERRAAGG